MRRIVQTVIAGLLVLVGYPLGMTITPLMEPETAFAADGTVTWCAEGGLEAALAAVQDSGGGTITFGCSGVITIDRGAKTISSDVTILGHPSVVIDGGGRLPNQLFSVISGGNLTLIGMTLRNGSTIAVGGAIKNTGTLTIIGSTFSNNSAGGDGSGGGAISNSGTLTVKSSTFSNNNATNGGGAILNHGVATITDSTFSGNGAGSDGGAIRNNYGALTVANSSFTDNNAGSDGGAIDSINGPATVTDSTFDSNSAGRGGAIYHAKNMTVATSAFSNNSAVTDGGAIYNLSAVLTVTASTLNDNSAGANGGAISNVGPLSTTATVTASTFSANVAGNLGGAIHNIATATAKASTFSGNSASQGGAISNSGYATITSSILAGSTRGFNCAGTITSGGSNLSDDATCSLDGSGDQEGISVTTGLGNLQDNGGPTATMLPAETSDAIDAANCSVSSEKDQRGAPRPAASGLGCDIGAVEVEGIVPDLPIIPVELFAASSPGGAEGSPILVYIFTAGPDNENLRYTTDCYNSGNYETSGTGGGTFGSGACIFSDDDSYTVGVQVCDGGDASNCDTGSTNVDVSNVAPLINAGNSGDILEGAFFSRSGSFTDPGADSWTATVDYGDGGGPQSLALDGAGFTLEHVYTDGLNDPYTVTVCVTDDDGGSECGSFSVAVWRGSELVGILIEPIAAAPLAEEIKTPLIEKLTEIGVSIDAGEIGTACYQFQAFSTYVEQQEGEGLPPEAVDFILDRVDIIYAFIGCTDINFDLSITGVICDSPVNEGSPATITVSATTPAGDDDTLAYAFDCDNDGSYETSGSGNQGQCSYADDGSYTVGVQVTDNAGGSANGSTVIDVINVAPLVDAGDDVGRRGARALQPLRLVHRSRGRYLGGDGRLRRRTWRRPLVLDETGFTLNHVYSDGDNDPYTVAICVTDDDGDKGCDSFNVEVLNAGDQVALLAAEIEDMGMSNGISKSLLNMLAEIDASIVANEMVDACNQLRAFSNYRAQVNKRVRNPMLIRSLLLSTVSTSHSAASRR
ncbi:MAG: PKD domain-containing protein [Thermomicrobiales bacterium]